MGTRSKAAAPPDGEELAPDWTGQTFTQRIHHCRVMLAIHGFLSEGESERVKGRQIKRGAVPGDAVIGGLRRSKRA